MYRFIETIACIGGSYPLLYWHQRRVNETFAAFFDDQRPHRLEELLPVAVGEGLYKTRFIYDGGMFRIEQLPYSRPAIRTLRLVEGAGLDYRYKFADRGGLKDLYARRGGADDILIVVDGRLTDSYFANVCLYDGEGWITPDTCLLNGVRRRHLLHGGVIREVPVTTGDLTRYTHISLINAMNELGEVILPTDRILQGLLNNT